jgi:hypothetical protein
MPEDLGIGCKIQKKINRNQDLSIKSHSFRGTGNEEFKN